MVVAFVGCSSCATSGFFFGSGDLFRDKRRSFIKIDIRKNIFIENTTQENPKEEYEIDLYSSASGFIVGHDRDITLVATSAHVCTVLFGNQINFFLPHFSQDDPDWEVKEFSKFILNDYKGKVYGAIPLKYNLRADICILGAPKITLPKLSISRQEPLIGEKYYNIAAPMGIWSTKAIPLFEGRYLGKMQIRNDRAPAYLFSIPTKGGSSGSPIINKYGEVVGVTHSAYRGFENICVATTHYQLNKLYSQTMMKLLKNYDEYKVIIDMINL